MALVQKRYEDAEKAFRRAIKLEEDNSSAHCNLGSLLTLLERYDEAETHLRQAVTLDSYAENYIELGLCLFRQKKYAEAIREYRQAVQLEPKNVKAQQGLTLSLMVLERFDEAEHQLRFLAESKANSRVDSQDVWVIHETLAELFTRLGNKRGDEMYYDEAMIEVDKAISGAPDGRKKAELYFKRGIINCYRKQYEVAEKDFERCVNLDKKHWAAKRNLERLQTSLQGRRSKTLEKSGKALACLGITQLVGLWVLYTTGLAYGKEYVSAITFGVLAPVFFAFTLICLLLPQLSKLKVGGLEAELEKTTLEPLEGPKGPRLEMSGTLTPSSNIAPEPGKAEEKETGTLQLSA